MLAEMIDLDCQREIELLLHNIGKDKYVWNIERRSLKVFLSVLDENIQNF